MMLCFEISLPNNKATFYTISSGREYFSVSNKAIFLHSMEKKSTKVDFNPISCKKAPFYTRNGHF